MKHLKQFEKYSELNPGDEVVLKNTTEYTSKLGFKEGDIYTLEYIDNTPGDSYRYMIRDKTGKGIWFQRVNLRKATTEEINAIKYNI